MASDVAVPTPMTVLGGYLGAGKTTLLNEALSSDHPGRLAVIVNDFGSVNIDADLIRSRTGNALELTNGCVCCDLADGMAAVMDQLKSMRPAPAHVVVEVSGVGNPRAVASWAWHPGFELNKVLVCVDVTTVQARCSDRWVADTVRQQLASADELLLTKTDLVPCADADAIREWLSREVSGVPVKDDRKRVVADLLRSAGASRSGPGAFVADTRGQHEHAGIHDSYSVEFDDAVDLVAVQDLLSNLPVDVMRVKAVLQTRQDPGRRTVVQWAGTHVETHDDGAWRPGDRSALVVITAGPEAALPNLTRRIEDVLPVALHRLADGSESGPNGSITRERSDPVEGIDPPEASI
jgi:G3E family GTPase